ncbi:hypothetical protein ACWD26_05830 [Streptomyces sp. NPDC002787]
MTGLVLVTGMLVVLVAGAGPATYAAEPDPSTSWAGSRAGEGRERPGRQDAGPVEPEGEDDAYAPEEPGADPDGPGTTIAPEPSENAALPVPPGPPGSGSETVEEPVLPALALGSGLMLMGLGLGLAFVGLRIRRD